MMREYVPVLLLAGLVVFNAIMMLMMSHMMSPRRPTQIKAAPYESGMPPIGGTRGRFDVKFYLIAVIFLIFDVELVFVIPWAVAFRQLGLVGLVEMFIFFGLLLVAYVYALLRGAFDFQ